MGREAAGFQAEDVGDIHRGERLPAAGQVAGAEKLEVVRGGVAGEAELLLALPEDFVDDCRGNAVAAEAAAGEVVAVVDQPVHRLGDRAYLVDQRARLAGERGTGRFRGRV